MLEILAGTKNRTAAEVAAWVVTEAPKISGRKVLYAVLAANTAVRAKVIVREENTKNGGSEKGLVETRVRRVSQKCFNTVGRARSRSKTWREWVKKVSKLPQGSLKMRLSNQRLATWPARA